jgi:adenosine deaminase
MVADWAVDNMQNGIIALGIGGPEIDNPPELFKGTFARALSAELPSLPHAGETEGPQSIWGAIESLQATRIGHGVRCLEDPFLVAHLRETQIPLDVSPTSNVCLGVAPSLQEHPLPALLDKGLFVTINSDDPPMFNTSLTQEYKRLQSTFGFDLEQIKTLVLNGVRASLLAENEKAKLEGDFELEFTRLRQVFDL